MADHLSRRGDSSTLHVVRTAFPWYSGMRGTSLCGVRGTDVLHSILDGDEPLLCRRCHRLLKETS